LKEKTEFGANPVRRVVTMLQMMAKKVEADGKKQEELFEKFMCYCDSNIGTLQKSIEDAKTKIPQVESDIKEAEALKAQLEEDLKNHRQDRTDAKGAMEKATSMREKEHGEFSAENSELESNIDALGRAIPAIEKGMAGSFLQTSNANVLRKLVISDKVQRLSDYDRQLLASFLSTSTTGKQGYAPASGEILGILKQMKDEMEADHKELKEAEAGAVQSYEELMAAKEKEIASATAAIEDKLGRVGEAAVQIVELKNDLDETVEALEEDTKFLADLGKTCETKKKEWAVICKTRAEELLAIQETIKILNDDDALELFKKTLPSGASALLQVSRSNADIRHHALALIKGAQKKGQGRSLDLIAFALTGKKMNFDKVIKMIDDMVVVLKKEQTTDDDKKEYCEVQFDTTEDKIKESERTISQLEAKIADTEEGIKVVSDEIQALKDGIFALDKSVYEATETRKEENAEYTETMAGNTAAVELIGFAKNRLNKFYNPKMYKPPPKRELTEEERITLNMGGTLEPTAPPGGIAGTGIGFMQSRDSAKPPPPPEAPGEYKKKGQESNGVMAMMDMMVADLEKEMQEADVDEKNAQEEYTEFMADSKEKRAQDSKAIVEKEAAKAALEGDLETANNDKKAEQKTLLATKEYLADVHGECDWLIENYQLRKDARTEETEALKKAHAVLSGADFSLLQTGAAVRRNLRAHQQK